MPGSPPRILSNKNVFWTRVKAALKNVVVLLTKLYKILVFERIVRIIPRVNMNLSRGRLVNNINMGTAGSGPASPVV